MCVCKYIYEYPDSAAMSSGKEEPNTIPRSPKQQILNKLYELLFLKNGNSQVALITNLYKNTIATDTHNPIIF